MTLDTTRLEDLMREVADLVILPRFRALSADDIEEKSKGDFVTVADREAEEWLTPKLREIVPGSIVVGEEATAADPGLLDRRGETGPVWFVDPIDGTSLFVEGSDRFAIMIALAEAGEVRHSAILFPARDEFFAASAGDGAYLTAAGERQRLSLTGTGPLTADACGAIYSRHFPEGWEEALDRLTATARYTRPEMCAAREYTNIARGEKDFVIYHRMLPWDHAPGSLILREAGGIVRNMQSSEDYRPGHLHGPHLLAANQAVWDDVRACVIPEDGGNA